LPIASLSLHINFLPITIVANLLLRFFKKHNNMNEAKKIKSGDLNSNTPVQKSPAKNKGGNSNKNTSSKGKSNKNVPGSPTTEVNPEG
jgi:hypothetical protein